MCSLNSDVKKLQALRLHCIPSYWDYFQNPFDYVLTKGDNIQCLQAIGGLGKPLQLACSKNQWVKQVSSLNHMGGGGGETPANWIKQQCFPRIPLLLQ